MRFGLLGFEFLMRTCAIDSPIGLVCIILIILSELGRAAIPVPTVYAEFSFHVAGHRVGVSETERIVDGEFQKILVPGRQVNFELGPVWFEIPCSLREMNFMAVLIGLVSVVGVIVFQRRRGAARSCDDSWPNP